MLVERVYDFLSYGEPPLKAECIFVLAGKQERKTYGIELWKAAWAPELILSVGRFEWRRFYTLGFPRDGGLKELVDSTPPTERHFFVCFVTDDARAVRTKKGKYGTISEADALTVLLKGRRVRSVLVVSTSIHLRRVALAFRNTFKGSGVRLSFVPVPEDFSSIRRQDLASSPEMRREVWQEFRKFLGYRLVFACGSLWMRINQTGGRDHTQRRSEEKNGS